MHPIAHRAFTGTFMLLALAGVAHAQDAAAPPKAATCVACHGPNGNSVSGAFPVLAGQTMRYLYVELKDFQAKRRNDPIMSPQVEGMTQDEMMALAEYFSKQKTAPTGFKPDAARAAKGEKIATATLCTMCHLGGFAGQNEIPRVAGQQYDYIVKQLKAFKAKTRTNDGGAMTSVTSTMSDDDILDVANYVAGLY
ncbi:MAG: c-type cytochrome [Casimicrobiaceae bacterium]